MILGAHVPTAGGVSSAPGHAQTLGVAAIQIFSKNQQQWFAPPLKDEELEKWQKFRVECGVTHAVSHAAYLINLCASKPETLENSRRAYLDELVRGDQLGLSGVVLHPGSHMKAGEETGIRLIADSLRGILDKHPDGKSKILLEVTAGQGTNLGYKFEQVAELLRLTDAPTRAAVCLDTCHIHAAGYDWTTEDGYRYTFDQFDKIIGLNQIACFHINDSKKKLGSRVDRHEDIGKGEIGADPFKRLLEDPRFENIPALLETPGEIEDYARNLATLRRLLGGS